MAFGDVVRARRTELAIGLNDLAERMGISELLKRKPS